MNTTKYAAKRCLWAMALWSALTVGGGFSETGVNPFGARNAAAQEVGPVTAYRLETRTAYYPQEVTTYRIEYQTVYKPHTVTTYKQVWEPSEEVRRYTVRRPVVETEMREEQHVEYEPRVSYSLRHEDHGGWEAQQVVHPGAVSSHLAWQPAGYFVDPATGVTYYRRGGLAWATAKAPDRVEVQNVWKPNVVAVQVPQTTYVQKIVTHKVPVQVQKYVDEQREERIPIRVCKTVPVTETIQVPYRVEKVVPVKRTSYLPRVEYYRVPIDPCTGEPLRTIVPGRATTSDKLRPMPEEEESDDTGAPTGKKPIKRPEIGPGEEVKTKKPADAAANDKKADEKQSDDKKAATDESGKNSKAGDGTK